ncbi:stage III sporulation protein AB [Halobacillus sp. A1]|uniref:Stage III sporulation protein SpoIIIAB n=1 Tax=Halobacillus campisalis TaxID=435909 RepID=A0ABW2K542_9BACI|nr:MULTISPECIES: stage III sporulation protein SpoIIIAB [Halobacillus]MCP3032982.1 stage III sporulation protein AB [Halobacillus sp. A1]
MEWLGALIVLVATTWVGFDAASKFKKRPGQIRQWKSALQMIEAEMVYSQSSLWDVCEKLSKVLPSPICYFFSSLVNGKSTCTDFSELWTSELRKQWFWNAMAKSELDILIQFGNTLGQHDLDQQQKQIKLTLHHLDLQLNEAIEVSVKHQRLARGIGVLSGLLVVLLLI